MNTQVSNVAGYSPYSPYKMVYHCEQIMFKIKSNDGPKNHRKKIYEQNTQWVRERRKYPNDETFAVRKLVLVYHLLRSVGQNPFNNMDRN